MYSEVNNSNEVSKIRRGFRITDGSPYKEDLNIKRQCARFAVESLFVGPRSIYIEYCLGELDKNEVISMMQYTRLAARAQKKGKGRRVFVWCLLSPIKIDTTGFTQQELDTRFSTYQEFTNWLNTHWTLTLCEVVEIKKAFKEHYYEK